MERSIKSFLDLVDSFSFYVKELVLRGSLFILFSISIFGCKEATNEERIKNNPKSAYQIMNSFAKEKNWNKFSIVGSIDNYNYLYTREENIFAQVGGVNTYIGIIDLKNTNNKEVLLDNEISEYLKSVKTIKRSENNSIIALLSNGNKNSKNSTLVVSVKPDSSFCVAHYNYKFSDFYNNGIVLNNVKYRVNNISIISSIYIGKEGFQIVGNIFNEKGDLLGKSEDIFSSTLETKKFVDNVKDKIIERELIEEINSILEDFVSVSDLAEEGAQNAMRFNDKYRHKTIKLKGTVLDVDEPWLSGYKYRVTMNGCTILTDDRSIFELNKGEEGYIIGTCTNFDSNSYEITVVDGRAITGKYLGEWARHSLRESGRVDDLIKDNEDYTPYLLDTFENPFIEKRKEDLNTKTSLDENFEQNFTDKGDDNNQDDRYSELKDLVDEWNFKHTKYGALTLNSLYAKDVHFYGQTMSGIDCVKAIDKNINKYDSYSQEIVDSSLNYNFISDKDTEVTFVKRVTINGDVQDYTSSLIFRKYGDGWRIIQEN